MATHGPVVIASWSSALLEPDLAAFYAAQVRALEAHPDGIGCLFVAAPGVSISGRDARLASGLYTKAIAPHTRCFAHVVEGADAWIKAARSSLGALRSLQPSPYPTELFDDLDEATEWQVAQLNMPAAEARVLSMAAQRLRAGAQWRFC